MAASSQRRALGALFFLLGVGFAGVAYAAGVSAAGARRWVVVAAAAALAVWMWSLARQMLRRN